MPKMHPELTSKAEGTNALAIVSKSASAASAPSTAINATDSAKDYQWLLSAGSTVAELIGHGTPAVHLAKTLHKRMLESQTPVEPLLESSNISTAPVVSAPPAEAAPAPIEAQPAPVDPATQPVAGAVPAPVMPVMATAAPAAEIPTPAPGVYGYSATVAPYGYQPGGAWPYVEQDSGVQSPPGQQFGMHMIIVQACILALVAFIYWSFKDFPSREVSLNYDPIAFEKGYFVHGLFRCLSAPSICCLTTCCFTIRWADTIRMANLLPFVLALCILEGLMLLPEVAGIFTSDLQLEGLAFYLCVAFMVYYRQQIRKMFGMPHGDCQSVTEDCLAYSFCACCAAIQEARQLEDAWHIRHPAVTDAHEVQTYRQAYSGYGPPSTGKIPPQAVPQNVHHYQQAAAGGSHEQGHPRVWHSVQEAEAAFRAEHMQGGTFQPASQQSLQYR